MGLSYLLHLVFSASLSFCLDELLTRTCARSARIFDLADCPLWSLTGPAVTVLWPLARSGRGPASSRAAGLSSNGGPRAVALPSRLQGPFKFPLSHQRRFPAGGKRAQPTPRLGASRRERPPDNTALRRRLAPRCAHINVYAASPGGARRRPGARTSSGAAAALRLWVRSLGRSVGTRALPARPLRVMARISVE